MKNCNNDGRWQTARAFWVACGVLLVVGLAAVSQEPEAPQTAGPGQERKAPETLEAGASCVTEECHKDKASGPAVHKPVTEHGCEICHEQEGTRHAFELAEKPPALCFMCHKDVTKKKKFVHEPLKEDDGPCSFCHDSHVGQGKGLLKKKTINDQCLQCHRDVAKGDLYHKTEKAEKGCVGCHDPHASDVTKLLHAEGDDLCYKCHGDIKEKVAKGKSVHGPMNTGCQECHDAHKVRGGKGLAKSGMPLCMTCHSPFEATAAALGARHPRLAEGAACLRCHEPHAAAQKLLLRNSSRALCLECHKDDIKSEDGDTLEGLGRVIDSGAHLHGPLSRDDCAGCHEPHGSARFRFLRGSYPATFYSPYTKDSYGFCFSCHEATLAEEQRSASATQFRNGDLNLHYLHVNKANKGRTCGTCHDPHAGKSKHYLRDSITFGQWKLPIGYAATEHGGTCASGCHLTKSYDRANPVSYETPPEPLPSPGGGQQKTPAPQEQSPTGP